MLRAALTQGSIFKRIQSVIGTTCAHLVCPKRMFLGTHTLTF